MFVFSVRHDVRVKKFYIGSMGINDQTFVQEYEDPSSQQFRSLADQVDQQVSPRA